MSENDLQGSKDDFAGLIRTNEHTVAPSKQTKAKAWDARTALLNEGYEAEELLELSAEETIELARAEGLV